MVHYLNSIFLTEEIAHLFLLVRVEAYQTHLGVGICNHSIKEYGISAFLDRRNGFDGSMQTGIWQGLVSIFQAVQLIEEAFA